METTKDGVKEDVLNKIPLPATQDMKQPISDETKPDESTETVQDTKDDFKDEYGVSQSYLEALISGLHPKDETPSTATASSDPQQKPLSGKWVCAQSSQSKVDNHNKHITDRLEVLAKAYTHQGDRWRALGYSKPVNALKSYHKPITSYEGFRTLEDIRTKANLNHSQIIGLKHYDDFLDRMPREEAAAIEKTVKEAAQFLDPGLLAMACGSYRRGRTRGDVDVLISHPDGKSHRGVFSKVLQSLHQSGFLTDDLVSHEESGEHKKYMGVCRLPGPGRLHRRLDIIVVPYGEFACSLIYFTGSAHFNRSMRALAKTKRMSLSEHSLNSDVLRQGSLKVYGGTPLPTLTEKDVFTHLGIPFREPQERDW